MARNINSLYLAFRTGCLGENIFVAYFHFFASIITENDLQVVEDTAISKLFSEKYGFSLPLQFVRQVLSVGIEQKIIVDSKGKYIVDREILKAFYNADDSNFDLLWKHMLISFNNYLLSNELKFPEVDVETKILDYIDSNDDKILLRDWDVHNAETDQFNYAWNMFLRDTASSDEELFDFITAICSCNIIKQVAFFSGDGRSTYKDLNVYLDAPMVFSLLGMDIPERTESLIILLQDMQNAGCNTNIFDHTYGEIEGILQRASQWATSPSYNIQKANNVAKYFHDELQDPLVIAEYCETLESKINDLHITIRKTTYDPEQVRNQENENELFDMIAEKYACQGVLLDDKENSIRTDVRSIIMVYYERRGQVSTRIQSSGHILLTLNGSIANVSKNYESNRSNNSGHIPACISADIFGAVLWLFKPTKLVDYQRKQLLADCYVSLKPGKKLLEKFIEELTNAHNVGEITDAQFLFMRSHRVVGDALMNITKGDYARFNSRTYLEVYNEIVAIAEKKYTDEVRAHKATIIKSLETEQQNEIQLKQKDNAIASLNRKTDRLFCMIYKTCCVACAAFLLGIPYIAILTIVEIKKRDYTDSSTKSIIITSIYILLAVILGAIYKYSGSYVNKKIHYVLSRKLK